MHTGIWNRCQLKSQKINKNRNIIYCGISRFSNSLANSTQCDSENQHDKADWHIDIFADGKEVFCEFSFSSFIDLVFYIAFLTYPEEHDSSKSGSQWTNIDGKDIHPCGDDALNQEGHDNSDDCDDAACRYAGQMQFFLYGCNRCFV